MGTSNDELRGNTINLGAHEDGRRRAAGMRSAVGGSQ